MKHRAFFVANSSSSAFIIDKAYLSPKQIEDIHNHIAIGKEYKMDCRAEDAWSIGETERVVTCEVSMDNFDFRYFLGKIGVPESALEWKEFL